MATKRNYSRRLTEEETLKFIDSRTALQHKFVRKNFNRKAAWRCVAEDAGIEVETEQLAKKWSNLLVTYKKLINPPSGPGTDANELTPEYWPYFQKMHIFCSGKHNIYPPKTISSEQLESSFQDASYILESNSEIRDTFKAENGTEGTELDFSEELRTSSRMTNSTSNTEASTSTEPRAKRSKIDDQISAMVKRHKKTASKVNKVLSGIATIMRNRFGVEISSSSDSDD